MSNAQTEGQPTAVKPGRHRPAQLSDHVASYVRELIMSGQIRPGEFLRMERLAEELGVSATPVREGLLTVRGEGFVELEARRGFSVSSLSRDDIQDLFWIQATLSRLLAERAAARITAEDIAELESYQRALEKAVDVDELEAMNYRFHRTINRCAESSKLAWFLGTAARYAPRVFFGRIAGWQEAAISDHTEILEALRAGDGARAGEAMASHIEHAGTLLVKHLESESFWGDETA